MMMTQRGVAYIKIYQFQYSLSELSIYKIGDMQNTRLIPGKDQNV